LRRSSVPRPSRRSTASSRSLIWIDRSCARAPTLRPPNHPPAPSSAATAAPAAATR
jgi:hypothetical protein